jgi:hypothetical protein
MKETAKWHLLISIATTSLIVIARMAYLLTQP